MCSSEYYSCSTKHDSNSIGEYKMTVISHIMLVNILIYLTLFSMLPTALFWVSFFVEDETEIPTRIKVSLTVNVAMIVLLMVVMI